MEIQLIRLVDMYSFPKSATNTNDMTGFKNNFGRVSDCVKHKIHQINVLPLLLVEFYKQSLKRPKWQSKQNLLESTVPPGLL